MEDDPQTRAVIGAAMEVHRELGHGFLEPVYQEAMALELTVRGVPFEREKPLAIMYKGRVLSSSYRPDLVCFGEIIFELKALAAITNIEQAQLINYLKATGLWRGLLLNFGAPLLGVKRLVFGEPHTRAFIAENPDE